jgi:hypothetical protein
MEKTYAIETDVIKIKQLLGSINVDDPGFLAIKRYLLPKETLDIEDCLRVMVSLDYARLRLRIQGNISEEQSQTIQRAHDKIQDCLMGDYLIFSDEVFNK